MENDKDLAYAREVEKRFQNDDTLFLTYAPNSGLLSTQSLNTLKDITHELETLPTVKSVTSILTVPLLFSPPQELSTLANNIHTLSNSKPDMALVKQEFLTSPVYKGSLVSNDFTTTAIVITLKPDTKYYELLNQRNALQNKKDLTSKEKQELRSVITTFKAYRDEQRIQEKENIQKIRNIMAKYKSEADLFLGGVQMISNDIIAFVENDLLIYGSTLILLLIIILGVIFKQFKWITLPILICVLSVLAITSLLGYFSWEITVISSNFIALQLIITISIVLHLIVRYEELLKKYPRASHHRIILVTMLSKSKATVFAILTTIAGFSSLVFSSIYPVINLGWMMSAGIVLSLIISFILFPAVLVLLKKKPPKTKSYFNFSIPKLSSTIVLGDRYTIFLISALLILFSFSGSSKLIVENSFINYFKKDTAIYQGMKVIDEELGGTTPLDVVINFSEEEVSQPQTDMEEESFDSFESEFEAEEDTGQYWFTDTKMNLIKKVHQHLESIPEIGDVKSFATLLETGKRLNHDKDLDSIELGLLYKEIPAKYKDVVLAPYINTDHNQARFTMRIIDSNPELRRNELLSTIQSDLDRMIDPEVATFRLTNLMVLYNNMLQSLFDSQITTLGIVLLILFVMFMMLYRSILLTLIALSVNIIPIGVIFGFMGWFNIPLDIMTITIAAIAIGIGVDDTIHYLHRFHKEFKKDPDYPKIVHLTNNSTGNAMYYTSLSVIVGFSILVLSNLIPTIYFGLLTMLTMFIALVSNLVLLPRLLIYLQPYKPARMHKK
jgi:predicted RND superfamily exporter protein